MRIKNVLDVLPLPAQLSLFWQRITFSRITVFYFTFSVVHCFIQVVFQVQAFAINLEAADFLQSIVSKGDSYTPGFAVYEKGWLYFCRNAPASISTASCLSIWNGSQTNEAQLLEALAPALGTSPMPLPSSATVSSSSSSSNSTQTSATPSSSSSSLTSAQATPSSSSTTVVAPTASTSNSSAVSSTKTSSSESSLPTAEVTRTVIRTQFVLPTATPQSTTAPKVNPVGEIKRPVSNATNTDDDDDDDSVLVFEGRRKRAAPPVGQITATVSKGADGLTSVTLRGLGWNNQTVLLTQTCLITLNWPIQRLDNTKREDITFISFQFWVLGMSIVAILNESMPHIIASLLTHVLATAWGGFQISHTASFRQDFNRLTTTGACKPYNLLPNYWNQRAEAEVLSFALNALSMLVSAFLSWKLVKLFGWQTFKRVGASRTINRVYKLVLSLSIAIQLSLFFIVVTIALWIDQLWNGAIGHLALEGKTYKALMIVVLLLLTPWLTLGWVSVRRESKLFMVIFMIMSLGYLGGWGGMFASTTFRWTFVEWRFYTLMAIASVLLTLATFVLGLMCLVNFGKGLSRHLNALQPLPGEDFISEELENKNGDPEKVAFPAMDVPIPTFAATFGRGGDDGGAGAMRFAAPRLGPRFTNPSAEPFEPQPPSATPAPAYAPGHYRDASGASSLSYTSTTHAMPQLQRQETRDSQHSLRSDGSAESLSSSLSEVGRHHRYAARSKRWVIE